MEPADILRQGLAAHLEGRFEEAEKVYSRVRHEWPDVADAWHLSAALAHARRDLERAQSFVETALSLNPAFAEAHVTAGNIFKDLGELDAALAQCDAALTLNPALAEAHTNRSDLLRLLKRPEDALAAARRAVELNPSLPEAYGNLGAVLMDLDQWEDARIATQKASDLAPDNPVHYVNLSKVQRHLGAPAEALIAAKDAVALAPELPDALNALGNVHYAGREYEDAEDAYRRALRQRPDDAEILGNLGNALARQHRLTDAETVLRDSLSATPGNPVLLTNLGGVLLEAGDPTSALGYFAWALDGDPDQADAYWNRGLARLVMGDLSGGFEDYEHRWRLPESVLRHTSIPLWDGSGLEGKSILLHSEQGYGDTLQFIRFADRLADEGDGVYLETHGPLVRLLEGMDCLAGVFGRGAPLPDVDVQLPVLSLPHRCRVSPETLPVDIPYIPLFPGAALDLGPEKDLNIGVAWAGRPTHKNDANRSISLETLRPLFDVPAVGWISLQVDERHNEADDFGLPLMDLRPKIEDFADTATAIAGLDLVITVDTAVAHLAGALGKEVWILLPYAPDWRWLLEREDSPWYPSARLLRQPAPGDWNSVIGRVAQDLKDRVA